MLRNYRCAGAVSLFVVLYGCAPQMGPPPDAGASGGQAPLPGSGGGAAVGGSGSGGTLPVGSGGNTTIDIDPAGGATGSGSAAGLGTNGGYIELTAEQATDITGSQCAGQTVGVEPVPAVLEFIVDVSDSMRYDVNGDDTEPSAQNPNPSTLPTRWSLTQPALHAALDALGEDVYVGIQFYPSHDASMGGAPTPGCVDDTTGYPIDLLGPPGSAHRTSLADAVTNTLLSYGTPTHDAYVFAKENALDAFTEPGDKVAILITDGAPAQVLGCGPVTIGIDPQPIIDEVAAAAAEGVTTFIIGSPGSDTSMDNPPQDMRYWLSDAAIAGGTALPGCSSAGPNYCHFDMTTAPDFATALATTLAEISSSVAQTCTFATPAAETALDLEKTTVILKREDQTSTLILPDADSDCSAGGWTRGPNNEVILCPATCEMFSTTAGAEVSLSVGCKVTVR